MTHYSQTGLMPENVRQGEPIYGFATSQSFTEAMQKVAEVNSAFAELPSETRQAFGNDPAAWIDYIATPEPSSESNAPPEASQAVSSQPENQATEAGKDA